MPKKHFAEPARDSCQCVTSLLQRHLPEVFEKTEKPILLELTNLENGRFHRRVEDLRAAGRRLPERELMERILLDNEIESEKMEGELGVDRTTLSRFFKGESATGLRERILNQYPKEFRGFPYPPDRDEFFAGYHHAAVHVRKQILSALTASRAAKLPLSFENFCYLWHSFQVESWRSAIRNGDKASRESAAAIIAQQVQNEPPTYETRSYKTVQDLMDLHGEWGVWLRLIVFCSNERNEFSSIDVQPGDAK